MNIRLTPIATAAKWVQRSAADLALEIAEHNNRCGHIEQHAICIRPRGHEGSHQLESLDSVIPIH